MPRPSSGSQACALEHRTLQRGSLSRGRRPPLTTSSWQRKRPFFTVCRGSTKCRVKKSFKLRRRKKRRLLVKIVRFLDQLPIRRLQYLNEHVLAKAQRENGGEPQSHSDMTPVLQFLQTVATMQDRSRPFPATALFVRSFKTTWSASFTVSTMNTSSFVRKRKIWPAAWRSK